MSADVHHLKDGVLVAQIHIGDAGASGGVACHAVIAWHDHIAVKVSLWFFLLLSQRFLLLHGELGGHFLFNPNPSCLNHNISFPKNFHAF